MNQEKYIGMDVHQATISVAVMDAGGKLIMECFGDQGGHDCRVHPRIARNSVADLRGRHVRCLVTRSSETPREPAGGLRSGEETAFERMATRVTGSTRASWRSCYAATNSIPCTTESMGFAP
jgi:hypothetical protein